MIKVRNKRLMIDLIIVKILTNETFFGECKKVKL